MNNASSLSKALQTLCTHRDIVPCYYVRGADRFIITGIGATNGGAVVVSDQGNIVHVCQSKRAALAAINAN